MKPKHLTTLLHWEPKHIHEVLDLARKVKKDREKYRKALKGQSLAMIFEKPSTRTRVSFTVGMWELGGQPIYLSTIDMQLGRGETISDTAQVLSRYVHGIMARTYHQSTIDELAQYASVPVINGLSDLYHPCQVLADLQTVQEKFGMDVEGLHLAYIGDGNNMAHSLMIIGAKLGMKVTCISPKDYLPNPTVVKQVQEVTKKTQGVVEVTSDLEKVKGANVVVTDTWMSMGQSDPNGTKIKTFAPYQVNKAVMKKADKDAIFLHCLPCHRGEEVTAEVIDGPQSVVFDEAENRLHAQKAVMIYLMG
jgi:ornithine carbamoyltransferase